MAAGSCTITTGDETFAYDAAGNRTLAAGTSFAYDTEGQLCKVGATICGTPNVSYDSAGRTLTWNGWTLTNDGEGRLASACKVAGCATGDKVEMRYDGAGHRIELVTRPNGGATTTITFRYQGDAIAQELTNGTLTRTYVTDEAGAIVKVCDPACTGANPQYLVTWNGHGDALGLWLINSDGTLTLKNSFSYSTWGQPTTTTHNGGADLGFRYLYVGREGVAWDNAFSLGLHYMTARHYSPALGRFLQPDPSALEANLYNYATNSPLTRVDPAGTNDKKNDNAGGYAMSGGGKGVRGGKVPKPKPPKLPPIKSLAEVLRRPRLLCGKSPSRQLIMLAKREGWVIARLGHGGHKGEGLRMYDRNGRSISWHPGGGHHGRFPYWKVSDGSRLQKFGPDFPGSCP
jgi:RHS repeat-associated protein